jgi:hypothetical protein
MDGRIQMAWQRRALTPEQRLARHVLGQALSDAAKSRRQRFGSARQFLSANNRWLKFWASVAGVDVAVVLARVQPAPPDRALPTRRRAAGDQRPPLCSAAPARDASS